MKRQYLQTMFGGVWYLQHITKNNAFDATDDTDVVNSLTFTFFHSSDSGKD